MKAVTKGPKAFDQYYEQLLGERWPGLKAKLLEESPKPYLANTGYQMDEASMHAAWALEPHPGDSILDMCAAPGGKSLALIEKIQGQGEFVLNEYSLQRHKRLKAVIRDHVAENLRENVKITQHDATRWGLFEQEKYDRILIDAPCSGERHLLQDRKELESWSPKRSQKLAIRQHALLCAALEAVKVGGVMVYSTCAISPIENDEVIAKLLKKRKGRVEVLKPYPAPGEPTAYGWNIWPDHCEGLGPIYIARLRRCQ